MKKTVAKLLAASLLIGVLAQVGPAEAQFPGLTLPPPGDNQRSVTTQYMGMASVTIDYNSPDVHSPTGEDRAGKIWGGLVPYGMTNLGFGTCQECPWRVGANENTTIAFSHDVEVQGEPLKAGIYGLHMVAGEEEWTIIFSNNSTAWGSFFYDPSEDALRVTAKPEKAEYREWMSFDFIDRQLDSTTVALHWENLRVPFTIKLPDVVDLYVGNIRKELQNSPGFTWQSWAAAANFVVQRDAEGEHLEEALHWAEQGASAPFIGQKNFTTLSAKAAVLAKLDRGDEAKATMAEALDDPSVTPFQIHAYGRQLIGQGDAEAAMEVFEKNAERFGDDAWPVQVGLARGQSALGDYEKALEHARKALGQAPNDASRGNVEGLIKTLEEGKDIN